MKNKFNIKNWFALLLAPMLVISCADDDSTNIENSVKPNLTAEVTTYDVTEGEVASLSFQLDKPHNRPIQYRLVMLESSTATDQEDYIIPGCRSNDETCVAIEENGGPVGYIFEIPAYTTEYTVDITTILDEFAEETETLKLQVISNRTLLGTVNNLFIDINIQNATSNNLSMRLKWDGVFNSDGEEIDFCELDMDMELYDAAFDLVDYSYDYCPEELIMLSDDLPDGTYYLDISLWTTRGYAENINVPANVNFFKAGTDLNQTSDVSAFFPMQDGGLNDGNGAAIITFEIEKTGNTYSITDPDGNNAFQGRFGNSKFVEKLKRKPQK